MNEFDQIKESVEYRAYLMYQLRFYTDKLSEVNSLIESINSLYPETVIWEVMES